MADEKVETNRTRQLLQLAAEALDDGQDPLALAFLRDNEVTSDEAGDLADHIAIAINLMLWQMKNHPKRFAMESVQMVMDRIM